MSSTARAEFPADSTSNITMYVKRVGGLDIVPMCVPRRRPRFVSRAAHRIQHPITPGNASHVASYAAERMPRERRAAHANTRCPLSSPSADGRKRTMKGQHYHKRTSRNYPHLREDNGNNNKKSRAKGLEFKEGRAFRGKEIKAEAALRAGELPHKRR